MPEEDLLQQRRVKLDRLRARGIDPYPPRYRRTHSAAEAAALFAPWERTSPRIRSEASVPAVIQLLKSGRIDGPELREDINQLLRKRRSLAPLKQVTGAKSLSELSDLFFFTALQEVKHVAVAGRVTASRGMGKLTFLDLRDGSGRIQASFQRDRLGEERYALLKELDLGDFLGVEGTLFRTRAGEITVQARDFAVLAKAIRPLPEKWHGLKDVEQRYRQRYLDLIANEEVRRVFLLRSRVLSSVRRFLEGRGFVEVETPVLQPVAAGAMATPFVTHHRALDRTLYLRIATELHLKRLLVGGFDKVFEIGRIFRNEGIDLKHNPEFTTLESYESYADYHDVMRMVEEMFAAVAQDTLGAARIAYAGQQIDLTPPWRRLPLVEAIQERSGINILENALRSAEALRQAMRARGLTPKEGTSWPQLVDKLIGDTVEPTLLQPTFLVDYPVESSPLAKGVPGPEASGLVERFEGFVAGMEVANAFTELNDPLEQRRRMEAQEEARKLHAEEEFDRLDEDFLVAVEHGMPPAGGLGVGIDRLVMLLADKQSIREVILFPQLRTL